MMKSRILAAAALVALLFASPAFVPSAYAHDGKVHAGDLDITGFWARATIGNLKNTAAYLKVTNKGGEMDHLLSVSSPMAKMVHLHQTVMEGDVAKMESVDSLAIPAGGSAEFKPGGYHVMVMGLSKSLKDGDTLPVVLKFEKAGTVKLDVPVIKGAGPAMGNMHMNHGAMDGMKK